MTKEAQLKGFFRATSVITDIFPRRGARFLDLALGNLLGNKIVLNTVTRQARSRLKKAEHLRRFLVAADLNIGDAIIAQAGITALREIFPDSEIDYVAKKSTRDLLYGNPEILNLYPVYMGAPFPLDEDLKELSRIAKSGDYDLVINFSPMIADKVFGSRPVVNYSPMAARLVRNESSPEVVNNVVLQAHAFIGNIFKEFAAPDFGTRFDGVRVYLSDEAVEEAGSYLISRGVSQEQPLVMLNPDASARFTRIPFDLQLDLLKNLADFECTILLGAGHVDRFIEHELMYALPPNKRRKVVVIPRSTKLDVYAALIDFSNVYISGDTGPLHLAAARKFLRDSGRSLRNRTAVISIFGGTPPRIYGYDSSAPGYFPSSQDAPSKTFVAKTPCRNITCINKMAKTCRQVKCFLSLDPNEVVSEIGVHLEAVSKSRYGEQLQILAR